MVETTEGGFFEASLNRASDLHTPGEAGSRQEQPGQLRRAAEPGRAEPVGFGSDLAGLRPNKRGETRLSKRKHEQALW